jgi:hypothetical protein
MSREPIPILTRGQKLRMLVTAIVLLGMGVLALLFFSGGGPERCREVRAVDGAAYSVCCRSGLLAGACRVVEKPEPR